MILKCLELSNNLVILKAYKWDHSMDWCLLMFIILCVSARYRKCKENSAEGMSAFILIECISYSVIQQYANI